MAIQPQTFITRVRDHSTLSPQALFVAVTIAELRFRKRLKPHEPLTLTLAELAKQCHMGRRTAVRYRAECVESGWIKAKAEYRDGQQQATEYTLADPTDTGVKPPPRRRREPMTDATRELFAARKQGANAGTQQGANAGTQDQHQNPSELSARVAHKVGRVGPPKYVVTSSGADDDTAPSRVAEDATHKDEPANLTDTNGAAVPDAPGPATEAQRAAAQRELWAERDLARRSRYARRRSGDDERSIEARRYAAAAALAGLSSNEQYLADQAAQRTPPAEKPASSRRATGRGA